MTFTQLHLCPYEPHHHHNRFMALLLGPPGYTGIQTCINSLSHLPGIHTCINSLAHLVNLWPLHSYTYVHMNHTTTTTVLWPFFWDHLDIQVYRPALTLYLTCQVYAPALTLAHLPGIHTCIMPGIHTCINSLAHLPGIDICINSLPCNVCLLFS